MQKSFFWNIPLAIAVANSWGSFAQLPLDLKGTFYWWVPDTTFLSMAPVEIIFPPYDREARARNDYRSAASKSRISKGVSKDLSSLAPRVENFLDNLGVDMNMLNSMLLDQMNTGDSWRDVTCRWLQSNEEIWQSWLPDDTTCFGGFGLYDDVTSQFAADRTVREGKRWDGIGVGESGLLRCGGPSVLCWKVLETFCPGQALICYGQTVGFGCVGCT